MSAEEKFAVEVYFSDPDVDYEATEFDTFSKAVSQFAYKVSRYSNPETGKLLPFVAQIVVRDQDAEVLWETP